MIVECDKCHAKFRLDDSKVTDRGVKVRCSKCKNVFTVTKQSAGMDDKPIVSSASSPPPSPPPSQPSFIPPTPPTPPPEDDLGGFEFKDEPTPPPTTREKGETSLDSFGDLDFSDSDTSISDRTREKPEAQEKEGFEEDNFTFDEPEPSKAASSALSEESVEQDDFGDFDFEDEALSEPSSKLKDETFDELGGDIPDLGAQADASAMSDFDSDFSVNDFDLGNEEAPPASAPSSAGGDSAIDEYGDISLDDLGGGAPSAPSSVPVSDEGIDTSTEFQLDTGIGGRSEKEFKEAVGGAVDSYAFNGGASEALEVDIPVKPIGRTAEYEPPQPKVEKAPLASKPVGVTKGQGKGKGKKFVMAVIILCAIGGGLFYLNKQGKINLKEVSLANLNVDGIKKILGLKKEELPRGIWEIPTDQIRLYKVDRKDKKTLWVMRGKITSRFLETKKTIRIEGTVLDGTTTLTAQAIVGNKLSDEQLASLPLNTLMETVLNTVPLDENNDPFFMQTDQTAEFVIVFDKVSSPQPKLPDKPVKVVEAVTL